MTRVINTLRIKLNFRLHCADKDGSLFAVRGAIQTQSVRVLYLRHELRIRSRVHDRGPRSFLHSRGEPAERTALSTPLYAKYEKYTCIHVCAVKRWKLPLSASLCFISFAKKKKIVLFLLFFETVKKTHLRQRLARMGIYCVGNFRPDCRKNPSAEYFLT